MDIVVNFYNLHSYLCRAIIELVIVTNIVLIGFYCVKKIFDLTLTVEINLLKYFLWNVGSVITFLLLYYLKIIEVNHQSIVLISFAWNKLFINLHNNFNEKEQSNIEKGINNIKTIISSN